MAKKWAEILKDSQSYPDDFTVALKDGQTMTLADMRSYDKENEGALTSRLTAREKELEKREKTVNDASITLGGVVEKVATASGLTVDELLAGKTPTKRQVAAATDLDENDPLVGTVVKQMKAMQAKIDAQEQQIGSLRVAMGEDFPQYAQGRKGRTPTGDGIRPEKRPEGRQGTLGPRQSSSGSDVR
jgi:hypothetical protein